MQELTLIACSLVAATFLGCGDSAGSGTGGSGTGGSGTGGASMNGTPRGAWVVSFVQPNALDCSIASHNSAIGDVSVDQKTLLIEDGEMLVQGNASTAANVSCTVAPNGSTFDFAANESAQGSTLSLSVSGLSPAATKDNPSKGTVSYQSTMTLNAFSQADCSFYFLPAQGVSTGQAWLTFECDKIALAADNVCMLDPSYVAFENCLTATE